MQKITLMFKKEPEIQNLVTDMEMGKKLLLVASIASKSDESVEVTIEGATDDPTEAAALMADNADEKETSDEAGAGADEAEIPGAAAPCGSPNTPGGSIEQDLMAAGGPTT